VVVLEEQTRRSIHHHHPIVMRLIEGLRAVLEASLIAGTERVMRCASYQREQRTDRLLFVVVGVEIFGKRLMQERGMKSCQKDRSLLWLLEVEQEEG
jgi:hypothetical protein